MEIDSESRRLTTSRTILEVVAPRTVGCGDPLTELRGKGGASSADPASADKQKKVTFLDSKLWAFTLHHGGAESARRQNAQRVEKLVAQWPTWRLFCIHVAESYAFRALSSVSIILSAVSLAVMADNPREHPKAMTAEWMSHSCTLIFAFDMVFRAMSSTEVYWCGWLCWLLLDLLVVVAGVIEFVLAPPVEVAFLPARDAESRPRVLLTLQVLRVLRIVRFGRTLFNFRPVKVLMNALSEGLGNLLAVTAFVASVWLMFAVFFVSLVGQHTRSSNEQIAAAQERFKTVPNALLTCLEASTGGVQWGQTIVEPMLQSEDPYWVFSGLVLLVSVLLSTTCLWNQVLGIYMRQVFSVAHRTDEELAQHNLYDGRHSIRGLRALLEGVDTDGDGRVSTKEMEDGLLQDPQALWVLGLDPADLNTLHVSLAEAEPDGQRFVPISEFMFAVLKLRDGSKSTDMLNIDWRQKMVLRDIAELERRCKAEVHSLSEAVESAFATAKRLRGDAHGLRASVSKAKAHIVAEIAEEADRLEQEFRWNAVQAGMQEVRRRQEEEQAREAVEDRLNVLQHQMNLILQERLLQSACAQQSGGNAGTRAALRAAVRERLDTVLRPWLQQKLAEATEEEPPQQGDPAPEQPTELIQC